MSKLIGRESEIKRLRSAYQSDKSELIALYGRRRVGKTFLIREVFKKEIIFEIAGLYRGNMKDQLGNFSKALFKDRKAENQVSDWFEAFDRLEEFILRSRRKTKKVIFIDEFPWLATSRSKFLTAFEHFWNNFCTRRSDLMVIICGSAASFMIQKVIHNRGGLHNRITQQIRLLPFSMKETGRFLKSRGISYTLYDIIKIYMVMGGVPHYLEHLRKGLSVAQNIDEVCFSKDGVLRDEFDKLFVSLFDNSDKHLEIIRALGNSRKGLTRNELIEKSNIKSGGDLTRKIKELNESGFIEEYEYLGNKSRMALYRLSDEYSAFYLKFIEPDKLKGAGTWQRLETHQSYKTWCGLAFENLCLKHKNLIQEALGISGIYATFHTWFNKNAQIDLLIDRDDNVMNACEIKFYNSLFSIDKSYYLNLKNKINELKSDTGTNKSVFLTLISTYGLKENKYSRELVQNSINLKDLFE